MSRFNVQQNLKGLFNGFRKQIKRRDFWAYAGIGSYFAFINTYVGGAIPNINKSLADGETDLAKLYTSYLYPMISNSSFLFAPLAGHFMDTRGFKKMGYIAIAIFQLLILALMLPSIKAQILAFVLFSMGQGVMTAMQYSYISKLIMKYNQNSMQ